MGKHTSNGIDWVDVTTLLVGLQGIHECTVELTVTVGTQGHCGSLDFTLSAWIPTVEAQHTKVIAEVKGEWPDRKHPTFDSCVFAAAYELDRRFGQSYRVKPMEA